ncbi:UNVERIFIED_CONTAM: DUF2717 domain-containing protein [Kocuria sp. CPCC 205274]
MLPRYRNIIEQGASGAPAIPAIVAEYLLTILSSGYSFAVGNVTDLKEQGFSEQYILGYISAQEAAVQTIQRLLDSKVIEEDE